jgi:hypothetical protein
LIRQIVALGGELSQLKGLLPDPVIKRLREVQRQYRKNNVLPPDAPAT